MIVDSIGQVCVRQDDSGQKLDSPNKRKIARRARESKATARGVHNHFEMLVETWNHLNCLNALN